MSDRLRRLVLRLLRLLVFDEEYMELLSEEEADEYMWASVGD